LSAYLPAALYPSGRLLVFISVRCRVDPRAIVRLEGWHQLKQIHLIGTRSRDLLACSIVPQSTTLPRAPLEQFGSTAILYELYLERVRFESQTGSYHRRIYRGFPQFQANVQVRFKRDLMSRSGSLLTHTWVQLHLT
jgi:hypothetical protein